MKKLLAAFILAFVVISSIGCAIERDTTRLEWFPHRASSFVTTPAGHKRDAGPFKSVEAGFVTNEEIDAAVDAGFENFGKIFPHLVSKIGNPPVVINDDYVMFIPWLGDEAWAAGLEGPTKDGHINLCLWARKEGPTAPEGKIYIVRPPGVYWKVPYSGYRWTGSPLVPALEHELLHVAISDDDHVGPEWDKLYAGQRR